MADEMRTILDKIAKLKTLAERPGTPEEAVAAIAAIQRLMLKHNMSEAQVDGATRNDERGFVKEEYDIGAAMIWRRLLLISIARYTFCEVVFAYSGRGANIIGEKHNIAAVKGLYEYLVDAVMRLADESWDKLDRWDRDNAKVRRWKNAFRIGAGDALRRRLKEQFEAQKKEAGESSVNALVVVNNAALRTAVKEFFPRIQSSKTQPGMSDGNGYGAGLVAGRSVNLAKQIEG